MNLARLQAGKRLNVLGLNSGTSADGLDLAVISIDRRRGGYRARFLAGRTRKYPTNLRRMVLDMADSQSVALDDVVYLDQALGLFIGRTAAVFVRALAKQNIRVNMVASHGQTVRHLPHPVRSAGSKVRGTLQLGNLDQIAALTERVVVGDFRQADVAAGGEGAPITTGALHRLAAVPEESRLIVNIGGMANFFYFPASRSGLELAAADCGPGNSLSDLISQRLFRVEFDRGGRLALSGNVSQRLLSLTRRQVQSGPRTISTGREQFGATLAERIMEQGRKLKLHKKDILATASELTSANIIDNCQILIDRDPRLSKLYLTGGGVHNKFFRRRLQEQLNGITIEPITALGLNPDLVEASTFAVMGEACLRSETLMPRPTSQGRPGLNSILGRIAQPPRKR